jgi:hypothetical protein
MRALASVSDVSTEGAAVLSSTFHKKNQYHVTSWHNDDSYFIHVVWINLLWIHSATELLLIRMIEYLTPKALVDGNVLLASGFVSFEMIMD